MIVTSFEWDNQNSYHIIKHKVSIQEVEEVCRNVSIIRKSRKERYIFFGQVHSGRYLAAIVEYKGRGLVRVITTRDMSKAEKQFYQRRQ